MKTVLCVSVRRQMARADICPYNTGGRIVFSVARFSVSAAAPYQDISYIRDRTPVGIMIQLSPYLSIDTGTRKMHVYLW